MDIEPNYSKYSLDELLDAASHVDREKYGDRARYIDKEIARRRQDREVILKTGKPEVIMPSRGPTEGGLRQNDNLSEVTRQVPETFEEKPNLRPRNRTMKMPLRQAFQKHLEHQYSLRLHMCAILLATTLSGILFSKTLLLFDVIDFRVRYPLAVFFSYLVFFACIKLWLSWVSSVRESKTSVADWFDLPTTSFRSGTGRAIPPFHGGGGQFSGAGASGSFDSPQTAFVETAALSGSSPGSGESPPEGIGEVAGGVADVLGDDNIIVAVIVLVVLVATIVLSAILLLYGAPAILAEAAFEGALAASLIKRTRAISDKAWAGSVFKATWKPFAVTLVIALFGGAVLHSYYPEAVRLADILWKG
jgi:hypothetical protein